jgi:predicted SAM-dependent methyltransferase
LAQHTKIHLACGSNIIDGWANIDLSGNKNVIRLDLTLPLPVNSKTIRFIYCEHFIEHISLEQAKGLLGECYRVLQPGGVLRLSTPNLRKGIDEYLSGRVSEWSDVGWNPSTPCRMMNEGLRLWGHQFVYDTDELENLLKETGFCNINRVTWRESKYEELKGLECRPFHDEIILECVK